MRHDRARDIIRAPQIGIDQLVKIRIRRLGDGQGGGVDARAVEDAVDAALNVVPECLGHDRVTLRAGAHIATEYAVRGGNIGQIFLHQGAEAVFVDIA